MEAARDRIGCPECGARVAVRLEGGRACPACESNRAWEGPAGAAKVLVFTREDIAAAEVRRAGEDAGRSRLRRILPSLPCGLAGLLAVAEGLLLVRFFRPQPIGPWAELKSELTRSATTVLLVGVAALLLGAWGLIRLRRGRLFRFWPLSGAGALGVLAGFAGGGVGGVSLATGAEGNGWDHTEMPLLDDSISASPSVRSIAHATAVILATDAEGDAHNLSIGAGAVVRSDPGRAWIVTCSHVAMPYAAVASFRDAAAAPAVWVYLADGRNGRGRVVWTAQPPLDVAVVAFDVANPPPAVRVSAQTQDVREGDAMVFAANPLRRGWRVHEGTVSKREPHSTPAGRYTLLFTDLPLEPGDSGSGLFDTEGRLVGINTWMVLGSPRPIGISLPSEAMQEIVGRLGTTDGGLEGTKGGGK